MISTNTLWRSKLSTREGFPSPQLTVFFFAVVHSSLSFSPCFRGVNNHLYFPFSLCWFASVPSIFSGTLDPWIFSLSLRSSTYFPFTNSFFSVYIHAQITPISNKNNSLKQPFLSFPFIANWKGYHFQGHLAYPGCEGESAKIYQSCSPIPVLILVLVHSFLFFPLWATQNTVPSYWLISHLGCKGETGRFFKPAEQNFHL